MYADHFVTQKQFREINSLVKTLLSRDFSQKGVRVNFRNFHTVCYGNSPSPLYLFCKIYVKSTDLERN